MYQNLNVSVLRTRDLPVGPGALACFNYLFLNITGNFELLNSTGNFEPQFYRFCNRAAVFQFISEVIT
jgi:hypothetical protein